MCGGKGEITIAGKGKGGKPAGGRSTDYTCDYYRPSGRTNEVEIDMQDTLEIMVSSL